MTQDEKKEHKQQPSGDSAKEPQPQQPVATPKSAERRAARRPIAVDRLKR